MKRSLAGMAIAAVVGVSGCADDGGVDAATPDEKVAAAELLCPVLWDWVKAVGGAFNDAAAGVGDIDTPDGRRERWFSAFDEIEALNAGLSADIGSMGDDPVLAPLVEQIERDLPRSLDALGDIEALFVEFPEVDENRHQDRTQQVIVRVEKVIELPKPELAPIDADGTLRAAFSSVPSCQHAVRDANDGIPRPND